MLQQILDSNPNLMVPLESQFMIALKKRHFKTKNWTKEKVDEFVDDLSKNEKLFFWGLDMATFRNDCHSIPLSEVSFRLLCKLVYLHFPSIYEKGEIQIIGDKNPDYAMHIGSLLDIFPDAKVIHILRDYRANIVSNRKWFPRKKIMVIAQKWLLYNQYIEKPKRKNPHLFYTIRYEDLVENPEKYCKEICEFIGIDFISEMLHFHSRISDEKEKRGKDTLHVKLLDTLHANLVKPINRDNVDSWKNEMTQEEMIIADFVDGKFAKRYGYLKLTDVWSFRLFILSFLTRIRYQLDVLIIRTYFIFPFWTRPVFEFISEKLYDWFGIVHIYNVKYKMRKENANQIK